MKEETTLLEGLKKGMESAYRGLVEGYSDRLFRIISRFVRNPEEAKEVLQTVFLKVIENIQKFEGNSSLYTWLYRIAVNEALMRIRSQKPRREISWEEVLPHYEDGIRTFEVPDWSKLPDQQLADRELQLFVQESVAELSEDLKAAYLLKDVEQLSEDEVCTILDLTKPAMKNRVHRARLFLRKRIEERYVR
ncbi:MAG: sigma-70 family RNA polymerase sigma factor [Deltaproteobacteria bacterium]|nr:sigma-70 family RNA polymerase sigma factor [Deltaproteobacteria bacterium]